MDKATADWYVSHTGGQLQAFHHTDWRWYLYEPNPVPPITARSDAAS